MQGDSNREKEIQERYKEEDKESEQSRYEKRYRRKLAERCEGKTMHYSNFIL